MTSKYIDSDGLSRLMDRLKSHYVPATQEKDGLMSADDKAKLDGVTGCAWTTAQITELLTNVADIYEDSAYLRTTPAFTQKVATGPVLPFPNPVAIIKMLTNDGDVDITVKAGELLLLVLKPGESITDLFVGGTISIESPEASPSHAYAYRMLSIE